MMLGVRGFTVRSIWIFLALFLCAHNVHAVDTQYLENNANVDGSISQWSDISLPYQSTVESVITYQEIGDATATPAENGRTYIAGATVGASTENLALHLLTTSSTASINSLLAKINRRQNSDGGFGAFPGFDSDPLSTTYGLRALSYVGLVNTVSGNAVGYLLAGQQNDGSWTLQDNENRTEMTAIVVNALWLYRHNYQLGSSLTDGIGYLWTQRAGSLWDELEASALALSAILNVVTDRTPYQTILSDFADLQQSDGSFGQDVYLTALGLRVIDAIGKPAPDETLITGRVVDGDSGAALTSAVVELTGAQTLQQTVDGNGQFDLRNLVPGNYTISISTDGFSTLILNTLLPLGAKADLGDLQLSRLQIDPGTGDPVTTGIVRGTVKDSRTGSPIDGATVTVVGQGLTTTTNQDGQYQINGVESGQIQVTVSASGYASVQGTANLPAQQTLIFSPSLQFVVGTGVAVQGVVTDRVDGTPLEGVQIDIIGGDSHLTTVSTDASGQYSVEGIVAGTASIQASMTGYHAVSASTTVEDGNRLEFSPLMDLISQNPVPSLGGLRGFVVDNVTGRGLASAQLTLTYADTGETFTLLSGNDGEFVFSDLTAGAATLTVELSGYVTFSGGLEMQAGLIIDVGSIGLQPVSAQPLASMNGSVLDVRTQEPISGAIISAVNTSTNATVEAVSDTQGHFDLSSVEAGEYDITVTYPDYNPQNFTVVVGPGDVLDLGEVRLRKPGVDALLADLAITEMDVSQLQSDQTTFNLSGDITGVIVNRGNAPVTVPFSIVAFEDIDNDGSYSLADNLLGTAAVAVNGSDPVNVDSSTIFSISVNGTQSFHNAPVSIFIDSNNVIAELSEANNVTSTAGLCVNQQKPNLDLALCMDASGSVSYSEFQLQLEGTARAIENENIVPRDGSVRVSALQFSSSSSVELNPTIIEEDNVLQVADAIRAIRKRGGGTSIHSCIDAASNLITNASPVSTLQVIDVSTDGRSSFNAAVDASQRAQNAGIDVLNSIGVGGGVNLNLLNAIVYPQPPGGDRGFVTTVSGYQEYINGIATKIQRETRLVDLTVGGLSLIDNGAGADSSLQATIGNGGSGDITESITIRFYNGLPEQGGQLIAEQIYINGLASGEGVQVNVDGISPANITTSELVVDVALEGGFAECNEDNNRQVIPVVSLLGEITVATDALVYGPNQAVDLQSTVTNTGALSGEFVAELLVEDQQGVVVASYSGINTGVVASGAAINHNEGWNTGTYVVGSYVLHGILRTSGGKIIDEDEAIFHIQHDAAAIAVSLRTSTDKPVYHTTDTVQIEDLVQNLTINMPVAGATLKLQVHDPSGGLVYEQQHPLDELLPRAQRTFIDTLSLSSAPEGNYQVSGVILDVSGDSLASDTAAFEVQEDLSISLIGSVTAQYPELYRGETQVCTDVVTNTRTKDITALRIQQLTVNVETLDQISATDLTRDIASGADTTAIRSLDTSSYEIGDHACILQAEINGEWKILDYAVFKVLEPPIKIDSTFETGNRGRLLVLLDDNSCGCWKFPPHGGHLFCEEGRRKHGCDHRGKRECSNQVGDWFDKKDPKWTKHCDQLCANNCGGKGTKSSDVWVQGNVVAKEAHQSGFSFEYQGKEDDEFGMYKLTGCDAKPGRHGGHGGHSSKCESDPYGPKEAPNLSEQRAYLESLLKADGWSYTIVTDAESFTRELRSGGYQIYALFNERVKLPEQVQKELREAVNRGEGLLVAGNHDERNGRLNEALGIQWRGHRNDATGILFEDSQLQLAGEENFTYADMVARITSQGADTVASFLSAEKPHRGGYGKGRSKGGCGGKQDKSDHDKNRADSCNGKPDKCGQDKQHGGCDGKPDKCGQDKQHGGCNNKPDIAVTTHSYGQGRAMYAAFDLLAQATAAGDTSKLADLIRASLQHVHSQTLTPVTGGVVPVTIKLTNQGIATPGRVVITLPDGSAVIDPGAAIEGDDSKLIWTFDLAEGQELTLNFWLRLPETAGPVSIDALIQTGLDPDYLDYEALNHVITAGQRGDLAQVLAEIDVLKGESRRYWPVSMTLHKAERYIEKGQYCKALKYLIMATDKLIRIDHEKADEIRLQVDWVIWDISRKLWAVILQAQSEQPETGKGCVAVNKHNKPGKECKR